jgi:hypothetical protein
MNSVTLGNFSNRPQRLACFPPQDNFCLEESLCEAAFVHPPSCVY